MKATVTEHGACFDVHLEPESMEDMATLVRMGMNATKELRSRETYLFTDHTCSASIVLGKRKQATSCIKGAH